MTNQQKNDLVKVYIGIGSNIDPERNLPLAISELANLLKDMNCASLYRTDPVGYLEQASFLNTVISGLTVLTPRELMLKLQSLEVKLGRDRDGIHWGPRTIDLDILLFGEITASDPDLVIPHKEMRSRRFVLEPLVELSPELIDPVTGFTFLSFLKKLPAEGVYRIGPTQ